MLTTHLTILKVMLTHLAPVLVELLNETRFIKAALDGELGLKGYFKPGRKIDFSNDDWHHDSIYDFGQGFHYKVLNHKIKDDYVALVDVKWNIGVEWWWNLPGLDVDMPEMLFRKADKAHSPLSTL